MKKSVIIAGGGLAGLSLGIALRLRGVNVCIHEASVYPRHRVCGEFISGVSDTVLSRLGIMEALRDAPRLTTACWNESSSATPLLSNIKVSGRAISRWTLDETLRGQFESLGGILSTCSRITPSEGTIWATGRVRHPDAALHWIGLKCHAKNLPLTHDLEMTIGTEGYIGLARLGDGTVNVCGLFRIRRSLTSKGSELLLEYLRLGGFHPLARRIGEAILDEKSFCGTSGFGFGEPSPPSSDFPIGDAARMIPPFTGNGMSMAFESADCALQPVLDYAEGTSSWSEACLENSRIQKRRFRKRLAVASLIQPLLMSRSGLFLLRTLSGTKTLPYGILLNLLR